jgi:hypothetical protein
MPSEPERTPCLPLEDATYALRKITDDKGKDHYLLIRRDTGSEWIIHICSYIHIPAHIL